MQNTQEQTSANAFKSLFENVTIPFIVLDSDGIIELYNPASAEIFGYQESEVTGKGFGFLTGREFAKKFFAKLREINDNPDLPINNVAYKFNAKLKDGSEKKLTLNLAKATFYNKTAFTINFDINDAHEADLISETATEQEVDSYQTKKRFISLISHKLRAPLNSVIGFGKLLAMDKNTLTNDQQSCIDQIVNSGNKLLNIVNQIIELSKVESGSIKLAKQTTSLKKIVSDSLIMLDKEIQNKKLLIITPTKVGAEDNVTADTKQLKLAIRALLSNAVQYNVPHGKIAIKIDQKDNGITRLEIKDSGLGIPAEKEDKLFTLFGKITEQSEGEHYGIGLYSAKKVIELMGGTIGYTRNAKQGSIFWVELGTAITSTPVQLPLFQQKKTGLAPTTRKNILYVDDSQANIDLMKLVTNKVEDISLDYCMNAEDGIKEAEKSFPDLIVMDLDLPGMNGLEAIQCLKKNPVTASIPTVILSSSRYNEQPNIEDYEGFTHFLTKPISTAKLSEVMSDIFNPATPQIPLGNTPNHTTTEIHAHR